MILTNKTTGAALTQSVPLDEIEFGIVPTLPVGEYAVYEPDGSPAWLHREIGGRWVRFPYIFRVER